MKTEKFQLSGTVEAQLKQVERYMKQLTRRSNKQVKIIPQVSILSHFKETPDEDGTFYKFLFPTNGTIIGMMVHVEYVPKDSGPVMECSFKKDNLSGIITIPVEGKTTSSDKRIPITAGTMATVKFRSVRNSNIPEIKGIWVGLQFEADRGGKPILVEDEEDEGI